MKVAFTHMTPAQVAKNVNAYLKPAETAADSGLHLTVTASLNAQATKTLALVDFKISYTRAYEVKDALKAEGFTFNADAKAWEKTLTYNTGTTIEAIVESLGPLKAAILADMARFGFDAIGVSGIYSCKLIPLLFPDFTYEQSIHSYVAPAPVAEATAEVSEEAATELFLNEVQARETAGTLSAEYAGRLRELAQGFLSFVFRADIAEKKVNSPETAAAYVENVYQELRTDTERLRNSGPLVIENDFTDPKTLAALEGYLNN